MNPVSRRINPYIFILPLIAFFLIPNISFAATTILVPTDQPTIQAGIDAAVDGDTVLVADGTYTGEGNKNIGFIGKAITVQSENGAENCIIDCELSGNGFNFHTGESVDSVVLGFTITNARWGIFGDSASISCNSSSPTISNCIISGNAGSGIDCYSSSPTISNCTINGNASHGIYCSSSSPTISDCSISANNGSGIYCPFSSSPTISNCIISENQGTGIGCNGGSPIIDKCIVWGNLTTESAGGVSLISCIDAKLTNSLIVGNTAFNAAGGIYTSSSSLEIVNCTITDNLANSDGGVSLGSGFPLIKNTIIWGNTPDTSTIGGSADVSYSDISGYSGPGIGNIDQNPLFIGGGNYQLSSNSPCIDTGTSQGAPDTDIDGNPRPLGAGYDMGAYELTGNTIPTANAGIEQIVFNKVTLDGSQSSDPDGSIVSYEWQLNHTTNPAYNRSATGMKTTVSNLKKGFYHVILTVTDDEGGIDTDTIVLAVAGMKVVVVPLLINE
jgi:parallel beta-helix repeat protein